MKSARLLCKVKNFVKRNKLKAKLLNEGNNKSQNLAKRNHFQIESNGVKSEVIKFVAAPEHGARVPLNFLHTADVGTFRPSVMVTKTMMERLKKKQNYNGMLHCGDISYANKFNNKRQKMSSQHVWDTWGLMAEPLSSRMAYMVSPGNHETAVLDSNKENGTILAKRFIMPGNEHFYSFSVGMVHFISVSTDEDIDQSSTQGIWLDRTLAWINKKRDLWPWIVIFMHRPIYSSGKNHGNWTGTNDYPWIKIELPTYEGWPDNFEALLLKHRVDLVLTGHVHNYERTWPVKNRDEVSQSYENVSSPIHITCGHGGSGLYRIVWATEDENTYNTHQPRFSAARDNEHWGHCELEFLDERTVRHTMYKMGDSDLPAEDVLITKATNINGVNHMNFNIRITFCSLYITWKLT